jgi:glycerophosphoryl diester phosphodiesterase
MKTRKFLLLVAVVLFTNSAFAKTKVIAHRGYWDTPGSAQNSIASLNKAHEANVYGSEFDVLITADGVLVVNHDDTINGLLIESSNFDQLKETRLSNGEKLPTLEEYLVAGKKNKGTQLILEIKPHKTKENEDRAVNATVELVKNLGIEQQVEYISFSMNICKKLVELSPKSQIAYLMSDKSPKELKEAGLTGLDYHYKVLLEIKPGWIDEAKALGLTVNVWTVDDLEMMKKLIDKNVDFITTDKPMELKSLLEK